MRVIDAIVKNADHHSSTREAFTPDRKNVDVIADSAACLSAIYLQTTEHQTDRCCNTSKFTLVIFMTHNACYVISSVSCQLR